MSAIGPKLRSIPGGLMYFCPACNTAHHVPLGRNGWSWNEKPESPSIVPSIFISANGLKCHSIITDGKITYLTDSSHKMLGQTVDLPDWPKGE